MKILVIGKSIKIYLLPHIPSMVYMNNGFHFCSVKSNGNKYLRGGG
jgi:hypothetical protein